MKRLGICEWSVPFEGEELFAWMKEQGVGNVSIGFEYDECKEKEVQKRWCTGTRELADAYGIDISILAVNTLCTYGMNHKEYEDIVKDIIKVAVETASMAQIPAIHLPSFVNGEIRSKEELEQVIVILQYACRLGEQYQVQIGYECALGEEDLGYVLSKVEGKTFYMLFDNENVSLRGIDPCKLYERFQKWYKHTHLKTASSENIIRPLEEETSFGGVACVMESMVQHGFDGWIIIESEYGKEKDRAVWEKVFEKDRDFIAGIYKLN